MLIFQKKTEFFKYKKTHIFFTAFTSNFLLSRLDSKNHSRKLNAQEYYNFSTIVALYITYLS